MTAGVANLSEDADFTDDHLREWAWRRKQFTLQKLMESAELNEEAAELIAAQQEAQRAASATGTPAASSKRRSLLPSRGPVSAEKRAAEEKRRAERKARKTKSMGGKLLAKNSFLSKILDNLHIQLEDIHVRRPSPPRRCALAPPHGLRMAFTRVPAPCVCRYVMAAARRGVDTAALRPRRHPRLLCHERRRHAHR